MSARSMFQPLARLGAAMALLLAVPATAQLYSDGYTFLQAVEDKDGTKVTEMLDKPGSTVINARDLTSGQTALHIATARRDATWIRFLAGRGANPNIRDKRGVSPLMAAVQLGFNEGVEALIAAGASVDVASDTGETPLISAVHRRDTALLRILLEAGADPERRDNSGRSARDYAELAGTAVADAIDRHTSDASARAASDETYGPSI
jgi:ankyrin repeat protein